MRALTPTDRTAKALAGLICGLALACVPQHAWAYVGPGAGLSLLGSLWWLLVAILTAVGIILYWPIRVLLRTLRGKRADAAEDTAAAEEASADGDSDGGEDDT